jgi:hypothetical protein
MDVILYLPPCEVAGKLKRLFLDRLTHEDITICHNTTSFSHEIRRASSQTIGVILIDTLNDLDEILLLGDILWHIRIILILPDDTPGTVARGHSVRPRFLTFHQNDLNEVVTVLQRMTGTNKVLLNQKKGG